jgi:hypothetical protein
MSIKGEIEKELLAHKKQQRLTTQISAILAISGGILFTPILSDRSMVGMVNFCVSRLPCHGENVHVATRTAFEKERENAYFSENVRVKRYIPPQDSRAIPMSALGSLLLLSAYGVSKLQTNRFKVGIHREYTNIKLEAIKRNAIAKAEMDLSLISKQSEVDVTRFAIEQKTVEAINSMKSPGQIEFEILQGSKAGELETAMHQVKLEQLNRERLKQQVKAKELEDKLNGKDSKKKDKDKENQELVLSPEHVWMNRVLKEPCKVVTGVSGSGKSTFERVMIQLARQEGHHIVILYPNTTRKAKNGAVVLSSPEDINEYLAGFNDLIVTRKKQAKDNGIDEDDYLDWVGKQSGEKGRLAIFAMEINNWESSGVDPDLIAAFYRLCFTDIRKWGVTLTMTGQSINQGAVASKLTSFSKLLGQQTTIICQATTDPTTGESISRGLAMVKFSDEKEPTERKLLFYQPKEKTVY